MVFSWIEQTVLPQMWAVGRQFGHPPTRGERVLQKMAKWSAVACAAMWWVLVGAAAIAVVAS